MPTITVSGAPLSLSTGQLAGAYRITGQLTGSSGQAEVQFGTATGTVEPGTSASVTMESESAIADQSVAGTRLGIALTLTDTSTGRSITYTAQDVFIPPPLPVPGQVVGLTAVSETSTQAVVEWDAEPDAASYEVWHVTAAGSPVNLLQTTSSTAATITNASGEPGATAHIAVRACNASGCGQFSAPFELQFGQPPTVVSSSCGACVATSSSAGSPGQKLCTLDWSDGTQTQVYVPCTPPPTVVSSSCGACVATSSSAGSPGQMLCTLDWSDGTQTQVYVPCTPPAPQPYVTSTSVGACVNGEQTVYDYWSDGTVTSYTQTCSSGAYGGGTTTPTSSSAPASSSGGGGGGAKIAAYTEAP